MGGVFAVLPTRNRSPLLRTALEEVLRTGVATVVVVNNASTDDTAEEVGRIHDSRLVLLDQPRNYGCAGGLYLGMRWSVEHGAHAIWVLDDDLLVDPSALPQMLAAANMSAPVIVRPRLRWRDRSASEQAVVPSSGGPPMPISVPLMGSVVSTAAIAIAGLPKWRFINGYEDVEYVERARGLGVVVVQADVDVGSHPAPRYVQTRRGSLSYWREVGPLFRLGISTRNVVYTTARMGDLFALGRILRRDMAGNLVWAARLYGPQAWRARLAVGAGVVSGLAAAALGSLENRSGESGPAIQRKRVSKPLGRDGARTLRYTMLFPELAEGHLTKDVGAIPLALQGCCGWHIEIASERRVDGAHDLGVHYAFGPTRTGSLRYLWNAGVRTDVLQMFHLTWRTVVRAALYRMRNRWGVTYVKADLDRADVERLEQRASRVMWRCLYWLALSRIDVVSVETRELLRRFQEVVRHCGRGRSVTCVLLPNCGFEIATVTRALETDTAEPIDLLNVGRLGAAQKATDILLEAFRLVVEDRGVSARLVLLGQPEPPFDALLSRWQERVHQRTRGLLEVWPPLADRAALASVYASAKVFVLPSRHESGPLTLAEAASCGCLLVTTPVGQAQDILASGAQGVLVPVDDAGALADAMIQALRFHDERDKRLARIRQFCRDMSWSGAVKPLADTLTAQRRLRHRALDPRTDVGAVRN